MFYRDTNIAYYYRELAGFYKCKLLGIKPPRLITAPLRAAD